MSTHPFFIHGQNERICISVTNHSGPPAIVAVSEAIVAPTSRTGMTKVGPDLAGNSRGFGFVASCQGVVLYRTANTGTRVVPRTRPLTRLMHNIHDSVRKSRRRPRSVAPTKITPYHAPVRTLFAAANEPSRLAQTPFHHKASEIAAKSQAYHVRSSVVHMPYRYLLVSTSDPALHLAPSD